MKVKGSLSVAFYHLRPFAPLFCSVGIAIDLLQKPSMGRIMLGFSRLSLFALSNGCPTAPAALSHSEYMGHGRSGLEYWVAQ